MAEAKKKAPKAESVIRAKSFLIKAIQKNDTKTLEKIMKAGYPVEEPIQTFMCQTPLMFAASVGQPEVLEELFKYNPDLSAVDIAGRTALHYCCRGGNLQNLRVILSKITDASLFEAQSNGGVTPLMSAIQSGNVYMVGHCLNSSFNPFAIDYTGRSCLDYAEPFKVVVGQSLKDLLITAQQQWEQQLAAELIQEKKTPPPEQTGFGEFLSDIRAIQQSEQSLKSQPNVTTTSLQTPQQSATSGGQQEDYKMDVV